MLSIKAKSTCILLSRQISLHIRLQLQQVLIWKIIKLYRSKKILTLILLCAAITNKMKHYGHTGLVFFEV